MGRCYFPRRLRATVQLFNEDGHMPKVGSTHYAYTATGKKAIPPTPGHKTAGPISRLQRWHVRKLASAG